MRLSKIPYDDFSHYLTERFMRIDTAKAEQMAERILLFTQCHPYYTQQLAFQVWNILEQENNAGNIVDCAVDELTQLHDFDYERIWMSMNKTDRHILTILAQNATSPLDSRKGIPTSTAFSALKRLSKQGYVIKNGKYEIDDPFFCTLDIQTDVVKIKGLPHRRQPSIYRISINVLLSNVLYRSRSRSRRIIIILGQSLVRVDFVLRNAPQ